MVKNKNTLDDVEVLLFDVYGTLTDWHSSVAREGAGLPTPHAGEIDWGEFVNRWRREGYLQKLAEIVSGVAPYQTTEALDLLPEGYPFIS